MSMTQQERLKQLVESLEVTKDMAKEAATLSDNPWEGAFLSRAAVELDCLLSGAKSAQRRLELEQGHRGPVKKSGPYDHHLEPLYRR